MNSEERLESIKKSVILKLEWHVQAYLNACISHNDSPEGYRDLDTYESLINNNKSFLKAHFPELDLKEVLKKARAEAVAELTSKSYGYTQEQTENHGMSERCLQY